MKHAGEYEGSPGRPCPTMNKDAPALPPGGQVVVYEASDGEVRVDVRFDRETVWLTQRQMSQVFDTTPENVLMHLRMNWRLWQLLRIS